MNAEYASIYKIKTLITELTEMTNMANINQFSVVLLFGRKKKNQAITQTSPPENPERTPKLKGTIVGKYEIIEGKLKFYAIKGVFKKRWVAISEFPIFEITNVDSIGHGLNLTWNGITYSFLHQKESETFSELRDQLLGLLAEQQQMTEKTRKENQLRAELVAVLNTTLGAVDLTFEILLELHEKRVNWKSLTAYSDNLTRGVSWTGEILPPLTVDFSSISDAITRQVPKEISRETLSVLKAIYIYFGSLPNKEDTEGSELFEKAKNAMICYLMLNDVIFARETGQKDDPQELEALEKALSRLSDESKIKISLDEIVASIQKTSEPGSKVDVDDFREIFRQQITLL